MVGFKRVGVLVLVLLQELFLEYVGDDGRFARLFNHHLVILVVAGVGLLRQRLLAGLVPLLVFRVLLLLLDVFLLLLQELLLLIRQLLGLLIQVFVRQFKLLLLFLDFDQLLKNDLLGLLRVVVQVLQIVRAILERHLQLFLVLGLDLELQLDLVQLQLQLFLPLGGNEVVEVLQLVYLRAELVVQLRDGRNHLFDLLIEVIDLAPEYDLVLVQDIHLLEQLDLFFLVLNLLLPELDADVVLDLALADLVLQVADSHVGHVDALRVVYQVALDVLVG